MRFLTCLSIVLLSSFITFAQSPDTVWTKSIGGTGNELSGTTLINSFGGYSAVLDISQDSFIYMASHSISSDGYISSNAGNDDIFLCKMNLDGDTLWTKIFGGSESERPFEILALGDTGCILVGYSISTDGPFSSNHASSYADGVVIRVDENGNTKWLKMFGGENLDYLYDIILCSDGNFMACGETGSNTGDLSGTGVGLNWVIKFNASNGNKIWSKCYEGPFSSNPNYIEGVFKLTELSGNNGIILGGYGTPNFNDFNADDIIYAKIDLNGNLAWFKSIGSSTGGDYTASILDASNGEFYIVGRLQGTGTDVTNYYGGGGDFWLIKFDSSGTKEWDKSYGGTEWEFPFDAVQDDYGNIFMGGFTRSSNNDASFNQQGLMDYWLVAVYPYGDTIWTQRYGGTSNEAITGLALLGNSTIFSAGRCESDNGYIHDHIGGRDIWVVRTDFLSLVNTPEHQYSQATLFPNPSLDGSFLVRLNDFSETADIRIFSTTGQVVFEQEDINSEAIIQTNLSDGIYFIDLYSANGFHTILRLVIQ